MEKYKQLDIDNLIYILNSPMSISENVKVQRIMEETLELYKVKTDVKDWYVKIEEVGFLVKLDSKFGFMYIVSECHTSQYSDTEGLRMALTHGKRTVFSVMEVVCEAAEVIAEQPCEVYVGNCTGTDNEHELCVFFPYGTEIDRISKTIGIANGTMKELAFKKWNSLVDIIKYG